MLKALTAAAAITICCLGNEYPAKACIGCSPQGQRIYQQDQLNRLRQEAEHQRYLIRHQMRRQQRQLQRVQNRQRYEGWN